MKNERIEEKDVRRTGEGLLCRHSETPENQAVKLRRFSDYSESQTRGSSTMRLRLVGRNDGGRCERASHYLPRRGEARRGARPSRFPNRISNLVELGKKFRLPQQEKASVLPLPTGEGRGEGAVKAAFTLAEVLITLGIIGIVAAMTMPTLMQKHRKQVVVSKLQKLSSTVSQAYRFAIAANDGIIPAKNVDLEPNNPDNAFEVFNKYYTPYLKVANVEKGNYGVYAFLQDGTALYFRRTQVCGSAWSCTYMIVCLTHKACKDFSEPAGTNINSIENGKDVFVLYTAGQAPNAVYAKFQETREQLINECKTHTGLEACTALIAGDGWKISDDYPIKL